MSWRDEARPIIARVLAELPGASLQEKRAALREAYPFGERKYFPYTVWCDECRIQLGLKKARERTGLTKKAGESFKPCDGQQDLF